MEYITKEATQKCLDDLSSENFIGNENDTFISLAEAKDRIEELPAADVVPKSEVEKLEQDVARLVQEKDALIKNYAECMKDYAREIFEEIEKVIGNKYECYVFDNIKIEGVE